MIGGMLLPASASAPSSTPPQPASANEDSASTTNCLPQMCMFGPVKLDVLSTETLRQQRRDHGREIKSTQSAHVPATPLSAAISASDRKLCVPASRRVCPCSERK